MRHATLPSLAFGVALLVLSAAVDAGAQTIGTFRWQLQPYCNTVTLNVTYAGGVYTLDGVDNQCGASRAASVVGLAYLNPDGTIGFGLTMVEPAGGAVDVTAAISMASLGGTWRDSAGNSGAFVFTPGAGTGGSLRPVPPNGIAPGSITAAQIAPGTITAAQVAPGTIGGSHINPAQIQTRVAGACSNNAIPTQESPAAAQAPPRDTQSDDARRTGVLCVLGDRAFPFRAGTDRCFAEIMVDTADGVRGQTLVPKSTIACLENTSPGPRVTFVYSSEREATCVMGTPATKDQYDWALAHLAPREKAFFLEHAEVVR